MKNIFIRIISFLFLLHTIGCKSVHFTNESPAIKGYHLIFSDEFNYSGIPDSSKWDYESGFIRNREPQWYQKENANVAKGFLTLTARKEEKINPNYDSTNSDWRINTKMSLYTSASLITKGKFDFKFGKVVFRAKINTETGQWPAFWMLGVNRGPIPWPACGEVDIMEYYRGLMHANLAWEGNNGKDIWSVKKHPLSLLGKDFSNTFHVWTMDWDEDYIKIFLDGVLMNETKIKDIRNSIRGNNPFHEKFYLVINLALGQANEIIPDNSLPSGFLIDYVRVYQKL